MTNTRIASLLTALAEQEQGKAEQAHREAESRIPGGSLQAVKLADRDRHTARAGAFLEAARVALEADK